MNVISEGLLQSMQKIDKYMMCVIEVSKSLDEYWKKVQSSVRKDVNQARPHLSPIESTLNNNMMAGN